MMVRIKFRLLRNMDITKACLTYEPMEYNILLGVNEFETLAAKQDDHRYNVKLIRNIL